MDFYKWVHRGSKNWFSRILLFILLLTAASSESQVNQKSGIYSYKKPTANGTGKIYMGREIAQLMDASGLDWLERNTRPQEENSDLAVSKFPFTSNSIVADIGAGSGYYTFKIASKLTGGKVYAVEIQDELISYLKNRKEQLKNNNVQIIKGNSQSPNLPENSIDLAFMVDVYHELLYPHEMLQNIRKALKKDGKLLLLEYKAEDPGVRIKELHKMSVRQVNKELRANGFSLQYQGDFLPIQHILIYEKSKLMG